VRRAAVFMLKLEVERWIGCAVQGGGGGEGGAVSAVRSGWVGLVGGVGAVLCRPGGCGCGRVPWVRLNKIAPAFPELSQGKGQRSRARREQRDAGARWYGCSVVGVQGAGRHVVQRHKAQTNKEAQIKKKKQTNKQSTNKLQACQRDEQAHVTCRPAAEHATCSRTILRSTRFKNRRRVL